jgi:hypothetical protein
MVIDRGIKKLKNEITKYFLYFQKIKYITLL